MTTFTADALLRQVADGLMGLPYETWNFGDSVAFEGLVAASAALGEDKYLEFARGWFRAWASINRPFRRLDCTAPGSAMVEVAQKSGDLRVLEHAVRLADYLIARPRLDSGLFATWGQSPLRHPYGGEQLSARGANAIARPPAGAFVDCLHFDPPFLTALGEAVDRPDLVAEGVAQAVAYIDRLQQPDGIFDHFELEGHNDTYGHGWGRGQGWALLGLLDVVRNTAEGTPGRNRVTAAVVDLVEAMVTLQRSDGHWPIDVRAPSSGDESSTAAFMAVGFRRARFADISLPHRLDLAGAEAAARNAVLQTLDDRGRLPVSAAVMACTTNSHYVNVPTGFTVPWGQGSVALMLAEGPA